MRRIVIALLIAICWPMMCMAQKGLAIDRVFDGRYQKDKKAVETLVRGAVLEKYKLDLYRSITLTGKPKDADFIVPLIKADTRSAVDIEESYKDGKLYYGLYKLSEKSKKKNRYILYLNQHVAGGNNIILLYLEGEAGLNRVKGMLKEK